MYFLSCTVGSSQILSPGYTHPSCYLSRCHCVHVTVLTKPITRFNTDLPGFAGDMQITTSPISKSLKWCVICSTATIPDMLKLGSIEGPTHYHNEINITLLLLPIFELTQVTSATYELKQCAKHPN